MERKFIMGERICAVSEKCLTLWSDLYLTSGIPFWISDMEGNELCSFPDDIGHTLNLEIFNFCIQEMKKNNIGYDIFLYYLDDAYYIAMCQFDHNVFMLSSPLTNEYHVSVPMSFLRNYVKESCLSDFAHFLGGIRAKQNFHVSRFINLVKEIYCGQSAGNIRIHHINRYLPVVLEEETAQSHMENPDNEESSYRYRISTAYEQDILSAIESGDVHAFFQAYFRPSDNEIGRMSLDSLRQQRYQFICQIYGISRAAIKGGINPELAFQLSDMYCQKMDLLTSAIDISKLILSAGSDFCQKVRDVKKIPELSPLLNTCCEYIRNHLYDPIHLDNLENIAHMNRRSLTIHFKRELGATIPQYVLKKKIEEARFLLTSSDISLLQISELLCFSSQSHFTQKFKEHFGVTPKQYRSAHQCSLLII